MSVLQDDPDKAPAEPSFQRIGTPNPLRPMALSSCAAWDTATAGALDTAETLVVRIPLRM